MIPAMNIVAWSKSAPWAEQRQIEQDLIISRALVELFNDPLLAEQLRFRGGTALNKLHFPTPLRYSEDIDLVTTADGPLKPLLDRVHDILDPWLGDPIFERSQVAPKFKYSVEAEDKTSKAPIRLKLEINRNEREAFDGARLLPFKVSNPWFSSETKIATFSNEELLSTKIRALLQRNKGRDLIDLSHALDVFPDFDTQKTIDLMGRYLELSETPITRPQAEQRMFAKRHNPAIIERLEASLANIATQISIGPDIAARHPGVSALGMQRLLDAFRNYKGDVENLLPAAVDSQDSYDRFVTIMRRINQYLFPAFTPDRIFPLHALIVQWLKGFSLSRMIERNIDYHRRTGRSFKLPVLIHNTKELVEQIARSIVSMEAPKIFIQSLHSRLAKEVYFISPSMCTHRLLVYVVRPISTPS